jgi:type II secretory pathway pseudopilin PulG
MAYQTNTSLSTKYSRFSQQGAGLILMVFILTLVVLAYTVKSLNGNDFRAKEATNTSQALAEAKAALMSWSINHPNTPGLMPYPDRNADAGGYDGLSDCPGGTTLYSHLIGRLPWKNADYDNCNVLLNGLGKEFLDGSNEPLWYAVSKNLVHIYSPTSDPVINPSMIDNPPYGAWMSVYDKNGQLVSNRIAVIVFAPGSSIGTQDRSGGNTDATNYLDTFDLQSGGGTKSNRTYSSANEDFYMGEDNSGVRSDNTVYQHPYFFNDKLVYITIDELMAEIEKRAAGEAKRVLQNYYTNSSAGISTKFFPYAAALGSSSNPNQCVQGNLQGLLPTNNPSNYNCSCTNTRSCTCSFGAISAVSYTRSSSSYGTIGVAAPTGACTVGGASNRTCTCRGLGSCKSNSGAIRFTCDACGVCAVLNNQAGSFTFTSTAGFSSASGGCSNSGGNINCNGTSAGTFTLNTCADPALATSASGLPTWFTSNLWQNYIYYAVSSNCTSSAINCTSATPQLTVGSKAGVRSLLIASGKPIIASPFASS